MIFMKVIFTLVEETAAIYGAAIAAALAVAIVGLQLRNFWLVIVAHVALSVWAVRDELHANVPDPDIVFMIGAAFRVTIANVCLFAGWGVCGMTLAYVRSWRVSRPPNVGDDKQRGS